MILKLARTRRNDASSAADDDTARARRKHCGPNTPSMFTQFSVADDPGGEKTTLELQVPDIYVRQAWNAQEPLSSCHHYLVCMHVILPAVFGIRMCFRCPDCNVDRTDGTTQNVVDVGCQDCMGLNMKSMGGYAGLATGMAFATEYQGESTPHGHGFVSLANMYQHCNLEEIGRMLEENRSSVAQDDLFTRVKNFVVHLQREDHFNKDNHQQDLA